MCLYHLNCLTSEDDPYDTEVIKRYDQMLHRTLSKIFRERCSTRRSDRMKDLLRSSRQTAQDYIIKLILELEPALGEMFYFPNGKKLSLLWTAVLLCCQKSTELLVQSGADVNERLGVKLNQNFFFAHYLNERTTILQALLKMHPSAWNERFIGLVTEHGADLNARDLDGWTALFVAVRKNRVKETKMLLEKGADVNAAENSGSTPLHIATINGAADEVVLLLLKHGADITLRCARGMNVLHYLARAPNLHTVEQTCNQARVLIEKGASLDDSILSNQYQPLHEAVYEGKVALAKLFLEHGAKVNARTLNSRFPLYIAAGYVLKDHYNVKNMITVLLEHGADIDMKICKGFTALHIACQSFDEESINTLLCFGADMQLKDNYGDMPYSLMIDMNTAHASTRLIIRKLALETACMRLSIGWEDEQRIKKDPELWSYYQDCIEQIRKANSTIIIGTCTFLDLLTKCQCELAPLMRNREFESMYRKHDLDVFPAYKDSISQAVNLIEQQYYRPMLQLENKIDEAFYYTLPHMIVRKVASYGLGCEKCKIREIVRASRGSGDNSNAMLEE